jgi:hypothetical protein
LKYSNNQNEKELRDPLLGLGSITWTTRVVNVNYYNSIINPKNRVLVLPVRIIKAVPQFNDTYEGVSKSFLTESITKYTSTKTKITNTREATERVMAAKYT